MVATLFDDIIKKGIHSGFVPARTKAAREWYRETADKIKSINSKSFHEGNKAALVSQPILGSMYMFFYDPKTSAELPYYDTFPLIFPFETAPGGFLGLNLHYLPPQYRAKLMDSLYEYANNEKYDESTKLRITYALMKKASKIPLFKPCVKRYLSSHVRSKFMYIAPNEWDIALFLPTERFKKESKQVIWANSKRTIRG